MKNKESLIDDLMRQAVIVKHWQSDVAFFQDEIYFLATLMDTYLKWLMIDENIGRTRVVASQVAKTGNECKLLDQQLRRHLEAISSAIKERSPEADKELMQEQERLESVFTKYVKEFREIKKEVFSLTERVMESEKNPLLLERS